MVRKDPNGDVRDFVCLELQLARPNCGRVTRMELESISNH
jgi:hypothetical protein